MNAQIYSSKGNMVYQIELAPGESKLSGGVYKTVVERNKPMRLFKQYDDGAWGKILNKFAVDVMLMTKRELGL